jgi:hypothetical protein
MAESRRCLKCEREFLLKANSKGLYCSSECWHQARRKDRQYGVRIARHEQSEAEAWAKYRELKAELRK